MVAAPKVLTRPVARAFQPRSQPAGQRAVHGKKKTHKAKPSIGRGNYVKAPLLRDKLTQPRWMANAAVNNPGNALAAGGLAGGGGYLASRRKVSKADERKKQVAAGAAVGAGAGHFARVGTDYGAKATAEHQFKPLTTKGNYGPYTEGPHKPTLNKYKRTPKGDVRQKAKMFDEHFPKGIPSYRARRLGTALNKKPAVAAAVLGGAALGAGASSRHRVNKSLSAFGVDHG